MCHRGISARAHKDLKHEKVKIKKHVTLVFVSDMEEDNVLM